MPSVFWNTVSLRSLDSATTALRVVVHVVAADLVGAVGEPVGVAGRSPTASRSLALFDAPAATTTMSAVVDLAARRPRDTTTPVTRPPAGRSRASPPRRRRAASTLGVVEDRPHGDRLGVGLGVHEARVAVAPRAADARAPRPVGLVEQDPARAPRTGGSRPPPRSSEISWMRGSWETAGHGYCFDQWPFGRIVAVVAVHLVQPLGLRVPRLEVVVADRPRRARRRRHA